jgi:uncharacterized membrane protein
MEAMAEDDKTKFWAILIMVMVAVAIAVTLVDMTIKAAILEESNALKERLNGVARSGSNKADSNGASNHAADNGSNDSDDVHLFPARMEAPTIRASRARKTPPGPMAGTTESSERNGDGGMAPDDKPVDS